MPDDFGFRPTIVVPLLKDSHANVYDSNNYRPTTLCPFTCKLFEQYILVCSGAFLGSSDLFGFKKKLGRISALLFYVKQWTTCFKTQLGVFAALDAKRAFDRVNRIKLFQFLIMMFHCHYSVLL